MVGVVRNGNAWRGDKVVYKEVGQDESAISVRVRELAESIERGTFPN